MKPNTIALYLLIDISRYALTKQSCIIKQYTAILDEYRRESQLDVRVSLAMFADSYQPLFWDKPLDEVKTITIEPNGQSSLLSSAHQMIDEAGVRLSAIPEEERPQKIVFVILTAGQDSVSDLRYTKQTLLEKIQHQERFYRWQFQLPVMKINEIYSTVVRIRKPVKKTTFQIISNLCIKEDETPERVAQRAIDYVYKWINLKLDVSTPEREKFNESFEFDQFVLPSLRVVSILNEGCWACRLMHADEKVEGEREAIPGMIWTSDIALHWNANQVQFAMRVFVTVTSDVEPVKSVRPRLIYDLATEIGFFDDAFLIQLKENIVESYADLERLHETLTLRIHHLPIILIDESLKETLSSLLLETQYSLHRQSVLGFAYVVLLPKHFHSKFAELHKCEFAAGSVQIYYPIETEEENNSSVYFADAVNTWHWDGQYGILAFALFLKDKLSEFVAERPMDWKDCSFEPKLRLRLNEIKKGQLLQGKEYQELFENAEKDIARYKKELEERKVEISQLKSDRFDLRQKLEHQYHPPQQFADTKEVTVKISKQAKKKLESIYGEARKTLLEMIEKCNDSEYRKRKKHPLNTTDLTIIKRGANTEERLAGYTDNGVFYITLVFDNHEDYEQAVRKYNVKDFRNTEFADTDELANLRL